MVLITKDINANNLIYQINLSNNKWKSLNADNLPPFKIEEKIRICDIYPNGCFPGSKIKDKNTQVSSVIKFHNYVEFSKITLDEVFEINGKFYLTTLFYDRREVGWSSSVNLTKKGKVVGYCLDGNVYCSGDRDHVYGIFYKFVYRSLIEDCAAFKEMVALIKSGLTLDLIGDDQEFIKWLAEIVLA